MKKIITILVISIMTFSCAKKILSNNSNEITEFSNIINEENIDMGGNITALEAPKKLFSEFTTKTFHKKIHPRFKDIHFAYDSYDLTELAKQNILYNVKIIKRIFPQNSELLFKIEGHTDSRGSNNYNISLGDRRAKSIQNYMMILGISPNITSIISYGGGTPLCQENREQCWQKNRRGHFKIFEEE